MVDKDPKRIKAYEAGLAAEALVRDHLIEHGFEVLAERYKTKSGELDLIASRGDLICFVEVKARSSVEEGLHSITQKAQRRLAAAATQWMADAHEIAEKATEFRFDVAVVTPDHQISLLENAFMTEG
ncbi:MAG: YraN family protein [Hyphomicrobiales bacterium]